MEDLLKYRFPNGRVVEKTGAFKSVVFSEVTEGFMVASFDKAEAFLFEEGESAVASKSFSKPICYSQEEYVKKADLFVKEIRKRKLSKAIFSRVKEQASSKSAEQLFEDLNKAYPKAFVYLISSGAFGTWLGATPETLVSCKNGMGRTISLAGTMKSDDHTKWGEKERFEQQFVSDFIEDQLKSLSLTSIEKDAPKDRIAGPVKHLETTFQFSLNNHRPIEIADQLHPTPAVSGLPQREAIALIQSVETHQRSLYAGCIGIVGEETNLFVNLRCAQVIDQAYFLYLGGGFTKDSVVEKEWQETENKSRTLLDILENS